MGCGDGGKCGVSLLRVITLSVVAVRQSGPETFNTFDFTFSSLILGTNLRDAGVHTCPPTETVCKCHRVWPRLYKDTDLIQTCFILLELHLLLNPRYQNKSLSWLKVLTENTEDFVCSCFWFSLFPSVRLCTEEMVNHYSGQQPIRFLWIRVLIPTATLCFAYCKLLVHTVGEAHETCVLTADNRGCLLTTELSWIWLWDHVWDFCRSPKWSHNVQENRQRDSLKELNSVPDVSGQFINVGWIKQKMYAKPRGL